MGDEQTKIRGSSSITISPSGNFCYECRSLRLSVGFHQAVNRGRHCDNPKTSDNGKLSQNASAMHS
eukprot:6464195-Amphidinium_carterae.1